jgi:hypothetical protein
MGEALEIARSLGLGGLGLLATVLSVKLAVQAVDLARAQQRRRNGNGGNGTSIALDELRLVCPLAPGSHSLGDIHDVLVEIRAGMERLNETQKEIMADTKERSHRLNDVLNALRLELARREA